MELLIPVAISDDPRDGKQMAGNYSSPATEDTGTTTRKILMLTNKRMQGVINKIVLFIRVFGKIGNGSGFDSTGY